MATASLTGLPRLPVEILSGILSYVEPEDLPRCSLASRLFHHTIKGNAAMFRALYLNYLVSEAVVPRPSSIRSRDSLWDSI